MATKRNEDDITRKFLNIARKLNEDTNNEQEIIIDRNDEKVQEFVSNINNFVGSVQIDNRSTIVYPNDNDVIFSGVITDLNDLKFQFRYNDQSGGLYIWADSMLLTKDVSDKLSKLVVIREQWKDYWGNNISQYTQKK